jgi:DNA polymerase delta subunit 1
MVLCHSEVQLFFQFKTIINQEDPDIMTGHNITGFDWGYYFDRCELLQVIGEMRDFSRIPYERCDAIIDTFKSVQVVAIPRRPLYCPGRLNVDFQVWIEKNKPANHYANYRLETIAQKELKQGKDDVSAEFMFDAYKRQCPRDLGIVARYCVLDSVLVEKLMTKLNVTNSLFAMAFDVNVPVSYLMEKGQTVKANAQLTEVGYSEGVLHPKLNADSDAFDGATVHPVVPGMYDGVICLDFGSLYPSIMITNSICPTTIVNDPKYLNLPGVEYNTIDWQKRVFTRTTTMNPQEQLTFTKFDMALGRFCHDDIKMRTIIDKSIPLLSSELAAPLESKTFYLLNNGLIKDVMATLKEMVNSENNFLICDVPLIHR